MRWYEHPRDLWWADEKCQHCLSRGKALQMVHSGLSTPSHSGSLHSKELFVPSLGRGYGGGISLLWQDVTRPRFFFTKSVHFVVEGSSPCLPERPLSKPLPLALLPISSHHNNIQTVGYIRRYAAPHPTREHTFKGDALLVRLARPRMERAHSKNQVKN